jgi:hypothetical protein
LLARYVGVYGKLVMVLRDGKLFRKRPGSAVLPLAPVTSDTFSIGSAGDTRVRFETAAASQA